MTKYLLNVTSVPPFLEGKPQQAIILCHGYGGDGKDISVLANNWRRFLPNAIFLCPDAPEICSVNSEGYQWFDLMSEDESKIVENSLIAEKKLNLFIDEILESLNLPPDKLGLVGFSQGCMLALQTALKREDKIKCILGYSGKIMNKNYLNGKIVSRPNIFLMHGDKDTVVPLSHLLEAKEFFNKNNYKIKTKIFKNCEHKISVKGSSLGLEFLKQNLL